jgi:hypothetical protein
MSGVAADWRRAALVDRFLRPRLAAGQQGTLPPAARSAHDADAYFTGQQLAGFARDADAYAVGLAGFVQDADAYAAAPAELAKAHAHARAPGPRPGWYFLSPGRCRGGASVWPRCGAASCRTCAGAGFPGGEWVPQRHDRRVEPGGAVRYVRRFFYVDAEKPMTPAGWVMVENGIIPELRKAPAEKSWSSASCTDRVVTASPTDK